MFKKDELKGQIAKSGYSQRKLAKEIGITETTFYNKMATGDFGRDEIEKMISILGISNPMDIFFA